MDGGAFDGIVGSERIAGAGSACRHPRKLAPPVLGDRMLERDRVTERIRAHLGQANVLAVYAAAGSGKTTAVAMALRDLGRPAAWLSLDGTESAAGRLLLYIEAAVTPHAPAASGVATDALAAGILIGEATGLLAEGLQGTGLVLVCDNAERIIGSDQALTVLSALARYAPADVGIVLISRTALPLDTGSTGELDRVAEVTGPDLVLDLQEAAEAARLSGRPASDAAETIRRHRRLGGGGAVRRRRGRRRAAPSPRLPHHACLGRAAGPRAAIPSLHQPARRGDDRRRARARPRGRDSESWPRCGAGTSPPPGPTTGPWSSARSSVTTCRSCWPSTTPVS